MTYGSRELKTQIISEGKVEKIAIEDDIQMRNNALGTRARIAYPRLPHMPFRCEYI